MFMSYETWLLEFPRAFAGTPLAQISHGQFIDKLQAFLTTTLCVVLWIVCSTRVRYIIYVTVHLFNVYTCQQCRNRRYTVASLYTTLRKLQCAHPCFCEYIRREIFSLNHLSVWLAPVVVMCSVDSRPSIYYKWRPCVEHDWGILVYISWFLV